MREEYSELGPVQEELEETLKGLTGNWRKAVMVVQYDEAGIQRNRKIAEEEQAVGDRLNSEISEYERRAFEREPLPEFHQQKEALAYTWEEAADREQKADVLEAECQKLLSSEQEMQDRLDSEY